MLPTRAISGFDFDNSARLTFGSVSSISSQSNGRALQLEWPLGQLVEDKCLKLSVSASSRVFMNATFLYCQLWNRSKIMKVRFSSSCITPVARGNWVMWLGNGGSCSIFLPSQYPDQLICCCFFEPLILGWGFHSILPIPGVTWVFHGRIDRPSARKNISLVSVHPRKLHITDFNLCRHAPISAKLIFC